MESPDLTFENLTQTERTKHVHRIHSYKGKFFPQLVEHFLGTYFQPDNIILDPFSGSGTTIVQANEMKMHGIGIDVSHFNNMIGFVKLCRQDFPRLKHAIGHMAYEGQAMIDCAMGFENEMSSALKDYNATLDFKEHPDKEQEIEIVNAFQSTYDRICEKHNFTYESGETFLQKWYSKQVQKEFMVCMNAIGDDEIGLALKIILSRVMRSSRLTTHLDIATLKEPCVKPYYCWKHKRICRPIMTMGRLLKSYAWDVYDRLIEFDRVRSNCKYAFITGDSRTVDVAGELEDDFRNIALDGIDGIFSSPPYVGVIDYHEQHAYSYEMFGLDRNDESEIGPLYKGQGKQAQESYARGIADVLVNCGRYLKPDAPIFLVANDKHNLYPRITEMAGLQLINRYERPVLNRTERNRSLYTETVFHLVNRI